MNVKNMEDVLYHGIKDLLSAERQIKDALPELAKAAEDEELADAFNKHQSETEEQISRLEKCFDLLGRTQTSEKCKAADGLIKEGEDIIDGDGKAPAKDVLLTAAGRKTQHYEIASYNDAINWANCLGRDEIASLLKETLKEEEAADAEFEKIGRRLAKCACE